MSKNIFITGTGTDIGKTFVTGLIVKKLHESGRSAAYYKAAMSGNERREDGSLIPPLEEMCPYIYENAFSPHLASRLEGNPVQMQVVKEGFEAVGRKYEYVTMEGSGGILCPLCYDEAKIQLEDVIRELGLACLIVADAGLGTINDVVLTAGYMRARNIPVKGIIFNHYHAGDVMEEDNRNMCESLTGLTVLACVKDGDTELAMEAEALASLYEPGEEVSI